MVADHDQSRRYFLHRNYSHPYYRDPHARKNWPGIEVLVRHSGVFCYV
ncbi:hypothetical protein [Streptosporangium sp. NPDC087985]